MNVKKINDFAYFAVMTYNSLPIDARIQVKEIKRKISGLNPKEGIIKSILYQFVFDGAPNEDAEGIVQKWLSSPYVYKNYLNRALDRFRNRQQLAAMRADW